MVKVVCTVRRLSTAFFGVAFSALLVFSASPALATTGDYQKCPVNSSCTVGEFLYNDDSTPLTGAACTYTARKPDGTLFINAATMTGASDGWYSYDINSTSAVEGLYRGTICCTPPGEDISCIERSFQVTAATSGGGGSSLTSEEIGNAVLDATRSSHNLPGTIGENLQNPSSISIADIWNYPSRSLTTFGSLASDVWNNSSRNLTGFGDLVSSIWDHSSRTLTANTLNDDKYLMTTGDYTSPTSVTNQTTITYNTLTDQLAATKVLLQKIIDEPTVETFVDDDADDNIQSKLQNTEQILLSLQDHVTRASNTTDLLLLTWDNVDPAKLSDQLDSTIQLLGTAVDTPRPETILDDTQRISSMWNSFQLTSTVDQSKAALIAANNAKKELLMGGKSSSTKQALQDTSKFIGMLQTLVGTPDDANTKATAFGFLKDTQKKAEALNQQAQTVNGLLSDWNTTNGTQRDQLLATVTTEINAVNAVPNSQLITTPIKEAQNSDIRQKNSIYGLKALIGANQRLLAKGPTGLVNLVWFEEGSVVFRFLATNPSKTTTQLAKISYPLPYEVEKDSIINLDPMFNIKFNPATSSYVVDGTVTLAPGETKTFAIEVNDVWKIPQDQIDALQKQANASSDSLKGTQFAGQAATLKKEIDTSFADISQNQKDTNPPDQRIRAYRQNQLSLVKIRQDIANLGAMSTSSSVTKTAFGFVGGVQVIIIWGMIIVLMAGFIYLALYTHAIQFKLKLEKKNPVKQQSPHSSVPIWKRLVFVLFLSTIATTTTASFGSALLAKQGLDKAQSLTTDQHQMVLGTSIEAPQKSLLLGNETPVPVYASPDESAQIYHKIPDDIYVFTKAKSKDWVQIQYTWGGLVYIGWVKEAQIQPIAQ